MMIIIFWEMTPCGSYKIRTDHQDRFEFPLRSTRPAIGVLTTSLERVERRTSLDLIARCKMVCVSFSLCTFAESVCFFNRRAFLALPAITFTVLWTWNGFKSYCSLCILESHSSDSRNLNGKNLWVFRKYLTTLSASKTIQLRKVGWLMNGNELGRVSKE
jgi:hypothetical protein